MSGSDRHGADRLGGGCLLRFTGLLVHHHGHAVAELHDAGQEQPGADQSDDGRHLVQRRG